MTQITWKQAVRFLKAAAIIAIVAVALIGWSSALGYKAEVDTLTTTQARQHPVTDYNNAFFDHLDCIKAYEIRFFADITDTLLAPNGTPEAATFAAQLKTDGVNLHAVFTDLCRSPVKPTFDKSGELQSPPVTYQQKPPQ